MDKDSAPLSRDRAQRLLEKNLEMESKRRKSAQSRIPSDPNAWQQMRENYESIILEDHSFSEQNNIEYALWQLHYKRIEELRTLFQSALSSVGSSASQGSKVPGRPDRVAKIRMQFKTFLSEASGFYHDLILKIRAKYGLPLGYFSEDADCRIVKEKDGKKSFELKKGLISCHRCLIYLGDLARYKGLYGDGDSKTREYAAASSYYLQAASLCPSSGNPHHQLAILASYSGDEFVAVYRYFRSLAVENPFVTARDNLIVAFEKNRQSFSQLLGDVKALSLRDSPSHFNGKGRTKADLKHAYKNSNVVAISDARESNVHDILKSFCTQFVRLHGILFTRTSLETFEEVLRLASDAFCDLLSSGPEESFSFGADATENSSFVVRLIFTLIFTVHNVKKEAEGQSYAEIVQRAVLLQNAFTAAFEISGHVLERVVQFSDPSSSFLFPGLLVFLEWLACHPDVATTTEADKKQNSVRMNFWKHCVIFLNKILSMSSSSLEENEDEQCFSNMRAYEEGETENRLALWEDFELRGFIPILPAHTILDFSRKRSFGTDNKKEKTARIMRVLAAGKALANTVKVDQTTIWFDSRSKKFIIGDIDLQLSEDHLLADSSVELKDQKTLESSETTDSISAFKSNPRLFAEVEEDDEVIVFKPLVSDMPSLTPRSPKAILNDLPHTDLLPGNQQLMPFTDTTSDRIQLRQVHGATPLSASSGINLQQQMQPMSVPSVKWSADIAAGLSHSLKNVKFMENGHLAEKFVTNEMVIPHPITRPLRMEPINSSSTFYGQPNMAEVAVTSKADVLSSSGAMSEYIVGRPSDSLLTLKRMPVGRPARHVGPPPGFSHVASKQVVESISDMKVEMMPSDDYSWLDGYQMPTRMSGAQNLDKVYSDATSTCMSNNVLSGKVNFPFPGKQNLPVPGQAENKSMWQNYQVVDDLKAQEQQLQQQLINGNQPFPAMPDQNHGQSIWSGRYIV